MSGPKRDINFIGLKRRASRHAHPSDRFTKRDLWAELEELKDRNDRAAAKAEDLRRDACQHRAPRAAVEWQAGEIRDILRDGRRPDPAEAERRGGFPPEPRGALPLISPPLPSWSLPGSPIASVDSEIRTPPAKKVSGLPAQIGPVNVANARVAGIDPEDNISPDELLLLRIMVALQGRELDDDLQGLPRFPGPADRVEEIRRILAADLGPIVGAWGRLRETLMSWRVTASLGLEGVALTARGGHLVARYLDDPVALIVPLREPGEDEVCVADTCDACGNRHVRGQDSECGDGEPEPSAPRGENEADDERLRTGGRRP